MNEVRLKEISESRGWRRLGHYHRNWFGYLRSDVDGPGFFFAPNGKTDPEAELKATIEAFDKNFEVGKLKQPPQCAFPERLRFVEENFGIKYNHVPCPKLDEFLARFNAQGATMVFSSAYPHNPGSMFGHTFLRINSKSPDKKKLDLLDQGVSYAANVPPDENGFAFAYLGLTGGYVGIFSINRYYEKVNEYINSESRDIWEYDLNLTEEETLRMLRHVWEIETNSFLYYFFLDENCSYQLLTILEVAKPDWDLSFFPIYVIPAETVKRITAIPGAVTGVRFRPSLQKKMFQRFESLSQSEREELERLIEPNSTTEKAPSHGAKVVSTDVAVLEATTAYLAYMKQKQEGTLDSNQSALFKESWAEFGRRNHVSGSARF